MIRDFVVSHEAFLWSLDSEHLAAGADIKEQSELSFVNAYNQDYLKNLNDGFFAAHKPIIGVINGIAVSLTRCVNSPRLK
jgi:enoyl-CoA hydratase